MFRIILLSSVLLLGACSTYHGPTSSNMSVNSNATYKPNSLGNSSTRIIENTYWRLPPGAANKHTQTVYFTINNLQDGELMTWQDSASSTSGSIKILMTNSYGGTYCRLLNSQVFYKHKTRNLSEYACSIDKGRTWTFRPYNG